MYILPVELVMNPQKLPTYYMGFKYVFYINFINLFITWGFKYVFYLYFLNVTCEEPKQKSKTKQKQKQRPLGIAGLFPENSTRSAFTFPFQTSAPILRNSCSVSMESNQGLRLWISKTDRGK